MWAVVGWGECCQKGVWALRGVELSEGSLCWGSCQKGVCGVVWWELSEGSVCAPILWGSRSNGW
jgi:hypothetical protein